MKLQIHHRKLTDSAYDSSNVDSIFLFTESEVNDFVQNLKNLNESCYYISGYRGVGKTSFLKKINEVLKKNNSEKPTDKNNYLFIHVNVSKSDNYQILIRKLIRQMYTNWTESNFGLDDITEALTDLNKKTFYTVTSNESNTDSTNRQSIASVNIDLKQLLFLLIPIFIIATNNISYYPYWQTKLADAICYAWIFTEMLKFSINYKTYNNTIKNKTLNSQSLYDDEIAEFEFLKLLGKIKNNKEKKIKAIFIIDELDKLECDEAKNILATLKSTLLSGYANFIIIGGQELYYNIYKSNESEDDSIFSTLFSKEKHIKLKSSAEFKKLFDHLIIDKTTIKSDEDKIAVDNYVARLILDSNKIPRKFINLIKNRIEWEDNKAFLTITRNQNENCIKTLEAIDYVVEYIIRDDLKTEPLIDANAMYLLKNFEAIINLNTSEEFESYLSSLK